MADHVLYFLQNGGYCLAQRRPQFSRSQIGSLKHDGLNRRRAFLFHKHSLLSKEAAQ